MKILLINGSPNAQGNTFNLLSFIDEELKKNGLETQWINIGKKAVHGCIDCGHCKTAKRCVFEDDLCNNIIEAILQADGVIVGSPVYFASANGSRFLFNLYLASNVCRKIWRGCCHSFPLWWNSRIRASA